MAEDRGGNSQGGAAKVTITDENRRTQPVDIRAGRIKITLQRVEDRLEAIEAQYPKRDAPARVVVRYNGLVKRDKVLITAYNAAIDEHNAILDAECELE